jgi:hypothetical protein
MLRLNNVIRLTNSELAVFRDITSNPYAFRGLWRNTVLRSWRPWLGWKRPTPPSSGKVQIVLCICSEN